MHKHRQAIPTCIANMHGTKEAAEAKTADKLTQQYSCNTRGLTGRASSYNTQEARQEA